MIISFYFINVLLAKKYDNKFLFNKFYLNQFLFNQFLLNKFILNKFYFRIIWIFLGNWYDSFWNSSNLFKSKNISFIK
jgi:hypothetical protein